MKLHEVLNRYRITTEPSNQGGGNCIWAFAERDGRQWFVKEFLNPKYPLDGSPGSERGRAVRRQNCDAFERRHLRIMGLLRERASGSGNLVVATDFFRADSTYFKVTERITHEPLPRLHDEEPRKAGVVVRTLVLSLKLLHDQRIVHGDLKPSNILMQSVAGSASGLSTAKLIDFDDSYLAGDPPAPDSTGGDPRFAAPEWFQYARSEPGEVSGAVLTCAADVFALGLVIHHQLTGTMPDFDEARFEGCAGLAAMAGAPIVPSPTVHPDMSELIRRMLHPDSGARPALDAVLKVLGDNKLYTRRSGASPAPADRPGSAGGGTSRVQSSMGRRRHRPDTPGGSGRRIVSSITPRTEERG